MFNYPSSARVTAIKLKLGIDERAVILNLMAVPQGVWDKKGDDPSGHLPEGLHFNLKIVSDVLATHTR